MMCNLSSLLQFWLSRPRPSVRTMKVILNLSTPLRLMSGILVALGKSAIAPEGFSFRNNPASTQFLGGASTPACLDSHCWATSAAGDSTSFYRAALRIAR